MICFASAKHKRLQGTHWPRIKVKKNKNKNKKKRRKGKERNSLKHVHTGLTSLINSFWDIFSSWKKKKIFCFALLYSLWQVKLNFCQSFPLIEYTNHLGRPIVYELMIQSHQPICSFLSATSIPRDLSWGPLLTTSCSENCRLWSSHFIYGNTESQSKKFQQNNFFF